MRLLNSRTLQLTEFFDSDVPPYAILSHRWEKEEVTLQDMEGHHAPLKAGYTKIVQCCRQAAGDGFDYAWVDTCCINKNSSAELSEAINSMYQWYKNAAICYVYLADVYVRNGVSQLFGESKWFTRGWTLQELIAPSNVSFFAWDWKFFGTKASLSPIIGYATGIDQDTLAGRSIRRLSIATRMSWASRRVTTRREDVAYSLIGIFGVNMPLLYGEGERAFTRLQEEIMKNSDDQSLFAWEDSCNETDDLVVDSYEGLVRGPLARSPAEFLNSGNIVPYRNWQCSLPYSMTNQGLRIELPMHIVFDEDNLALCLAVLGCHYEGDFSGPLGIFLRPLMRSHKSRFNTGLDGDQYARDHNNKRPVVVDPSTYFKATQKIVYLRQNVLLPANQDMNRQYGFLIRLHHQDSEFRVGYVYPQQRTIEARGNVAIIRSPSCKGAVLFCGSEGKRFWVTVRIDMPIPYEENDRWERGRCTCKIIVCRPFNGPADHGLGGLGTTQGSLFGYFEHLARCGSNKTFETLSEGQRVVAEIKKEVVMGERMLVVDVDIHSEYEGLYEML